MTTNGSVVDCVFFWIWVPFSYHDAICDCTLSEFQRFKHQSTTQSVLLNDVTTWKGRSKKNSIACCSCSRK